MRIKKIGLLAMALVLALGLTGAAFATWSDDVLIEGTAEMGSLTLGFEQGTAVCYDSDLPEDVPSAIVAHFTPMDFSYPDPNKPVSSCTVVTSVSETDEHSGKTVDKLLTITVDNAYPSLWGFVVVDLHNGGTVPIHITDVIVTPTSADLLWDEVQSEFWKDFDGDMGKDPEEIIMNFGVCKASAKTPIEWELLTDPLVCNQIDPCECLWILIWWHFKEDAEECHTYTFDVAVEGIQWNKA